MPLGLDLFDDLRRRRDAHELQIHFRSGRHGQRHPRLVRLYASLEANARLQVALIHEGLLDSLSAVTNFKEVVAVVRLDAELFTDEGLINAGRDIDRDFCDVGLWACRASRLRLATETDIVAEVHPVAVVFLTNCACLESTRDVVLGDPDLIVAVREVRRVDQLQLVGEFLADGESRAWVRFVGDERRLEPDFAEPGCLLQPATECGPDPAAR